MDMIERKSLPAALSEWIGDAELKDVSGWSGDKTWFIDKGDGAYLKIAAKGTLEQTAMLQKLWGERGLSAKVILYLSEDRDYFLTTPVPGKDGLWEKHLAEPEKLCRVFGSSLRTLHDSCTEGMPDELSPMLKQAETGAFNQWFLDDLKPFIGEMSAQCAQKTLADGKGVLKWDALVHGDYCLPNIMLSDWKLTGFIDIGASGRGDRHYDLVWGLWTILFNLKKSEYAELFLNAYGKDAIDIGRLRMCALLGALE